MGVLSEILTDMRGIKVMVCDAIDENSLSDDEGALLNY
jgi:hypothetical protein